MHAWCSYAFITGAAILLVRRMLIKIQGKGTHVIRPFG
jgi:hypothetical protein